MIGEQLSRIKAQPAVLALPCVWRLVGLRGEPAQI